MKHLYGQYMDTWITRSIHFDSPLHPTSPRSRAYQGLIFFLKKRTLLHVHRYATAVCVHIPRRLHPATGYHLQDGFSDKKILRIMVFMVATAPPSIHLWPMVMMLLQRYNVFFYLWFWLYRVYLGLHLVRLKVLRVVQVVWWWINNWTETLYFMVVIGRSLCLINYPTYTWFMCVYEFECLGGYVHYMNYILDALAEDSPVFYLLLRNAWTTNYWQILPK
jgi:hypothetical protein